MRKILLALALASALLAGSAGAARAKVFGHGSFVASAWIGGA
jgi:hypothetical protein